MMTGVWVSAPIATPAAIMAAVTQSVRVRRVELKRVSVEEIFIDLVHQK